jgi:hypothetical protein
MDKRINKKISEFISLFKDSIRDKATELGIMSNENVIPLMQFIYDYDRLYLTKEDFSKRKRVKNIVPFCERCVAKRATNEQCTRRRKNESEYCGTHIKGTPHGIIENECSSTDKKQNIQKIEVWAQDIQGIMYYIDNCNNVYKTEDIILNKVNPKIIAKYEKKEENYSIPEFGI